MAVPHLRSFQALEAALRLGSLRAAAAELAITPAAVGQRIKTLEDHLGFALVSRSRAGLRGTPEMAAATSHLERAFAELRAAAEQLEVQRVNEIHLAATSDWVELWLAPRLGSFRASHPNLQFSINGEGDARPRLGRVDCDVAFARPTGDDSELVLFHDYRVPVGSPANERRVSALPEATRLEGFPLLHLDFYKDDPAAYGWPEWIARHGMRSSPADRGIRFQRVVAALEAVRSDAGFVIGGLALLEERVRRGELSVPFPIATGAWTSFAFVARFAPAALQRPAVRRFRHWLRTEALVTQAWLEDALR